MSFLAELLDFRLFFLAALIFVPLERLFGARKGQPLLRRHWTNDLVYVFVNGLIIRLGLVALVSLILVSSRLLLPNELLTAVAAQPLWLQLIEVFLLADLGFYAVHRLFHSVPALWRIHQIHHSIEEMDWLAAARVHPIDQILTKGASLLPCFALGFSEWAITAFALTYHWHSMLLHSNLRLGFGPLSRLIASPDFHRWHHCRDREAWDRNFAGQLALWDFVFGTAYLPKGRQAERFGIGETLPEAYPAQLLHPFKRALSPRDSAAAQEIG
jgi:sterol desaturase/sphingolipid hydroxylase (fatty acid hydroxylase superfamily)